MHRVERHLLFGAVLLQPPGEVRCQLEQLADRLARLSHGAKLQHFAHHHQRHDHARRLEIGAHRAVVLAELLRKDVRQQDRDQAEKVREPDAQADQRVHVEAPASQRAPELGEERPTDPQHHWRAEGEFDPAAHARGDAERIGDAHHRRHGENHHRDRERDADPHAARVITQLRVVVVGRRSSAHRNERHAADGAVAGGVLQDLGVHGAGVLHAARRGRRGGLCRAMRVVDMSAMRLRRSFGVALRIRLEGVQAVRGAEQIGLAFVGQPAGFLAGRDRHAAHGIPGFGRSARIIHGSPCFLENPVSTLPPWERQAAMIRKSSPAPHQVTQCACAFVAL